MLVSDFLNIPGIFLTIKDHNITVIHCIYKKKKKQKTVDKNLDNNTIFCNTST